jgi:hypothetical protein
MQKRLIELSEQRGRLRERIAHQRTALARDFQPLLAPLSLPARLAASARHGWDFLRGHPYVAGSAALGLLVLKPRFVLRWAQRGLLAWRAWRSVRGMVPDLIRNFLVR